MGDFTSQGIHFSEALNETAQNPPDQDERGNNAISTTTENELTHTSALGRRRSHPC